MRYDASHTKVMSCTCKHATQDELYGVGKRLFNMKKEPYAVGNEGSRTVVADYRCTVCGNEINGLKV